MTTSQPDATDLIDVTIKLPKPPEGYEWDSYLRSPKRGEPFYKCLDGEICIAEVDFVGMYICCRRLPPPWTPPASAAPGVTFYPVLNEWRVTYGCVNKLIAPESWAATDMSLPAKIFADFIEPPERRPYRVPERSE